MPDKFPIQIEGFEPIERIGSGGFGDVWLARQTNLDRPVAIKVGNLPLVESAAKRRFSRECIALGRLSNTPNIVNVYTSGVSDSGAGLLRRVCKRW